MTPIERTFGRPAPLKPMMERGEEFFDAIDSLDIDSVLERARRINKIASAATILASRSLALEGDSISQSILKRAFVNIGNITARAVSDVGPDDAEQLLTSDQTHQTLLFASKALRGYRLDSLAKQFRTEGSGFQLTPNGLTMHDEYEIPDKHRGKGCPYAHGNPRHAEYFNNRTDTIVRTYTEAYRRGMPQTLTQQVLRR